jgi:hypothetical protein
MLDMMRGDRLAEDYQIWDHGVSIHTLIQKMEDGVNGAEI